MNTGIYFGLVESVLFYFCFADTTEIFPFCRQVDLVVMGRLEWL